LTDLEQHTAEHFLALAQQMGLIPSAWKADALNPPAQKYIAQGVAAVNLALEYGKNVMDAISTIPEELRGYVLKELYPEVRVGPPVLRSRREPWNHKFSSSNGQVWGNLYAYYLNHLAIEHSRLQRLDEQSDEVLFNLQDPDRNVPPGEPVKGLVVGYVQSGKTANYTAVIAKAFDAGYRLVIVMTGIHNSLRRQTQLRIERELGLVPSLDEGDSQVSLKNEKSQDPIVKMTSSDMYRGDALGSNVSNLVLSGQKSIFVVKKNVSVLKSLLAWLPDKFDYPVLIIDDEADQASINTNLSDETIIDEDGNEIRVKEQRTRTNDCITKLVKKFPRVSYVGYTATPYANVFIDAEDAIDLYPKDFIISLPKPFGYFGPSEFFGDPITGGDPEGYPNEFSMVEIVNSDETEIFKNIEKQIRLSKNQNQGNWDSGSTVDLPPGMQKAITHYFLAASALHCKHSKRVPTSMLVQASQLQEVQLAIRDALQIFTNQIRQEWRYNREESERHWKGEWGKMCTLIVSPTIKQPWERIRPYLSDLVGEFVGLQILCLNHKSDDELDYEIDPNFNGVVVGGNKLSRGLTMEGLLTSYFVRETKSPSADTLSQMGRFFGYRQEYADLVRVFTTESLLQDFKDIAFIEEELREELKLYSHKRGATPKDFGPRVALRGRLMPTRKPGGQIDTTTFTGTVKQTSILLSSTSLKGPFSQDDELVLSNHLENFATTSKFTEALRQNASSYSSEKGNHVFFDLSLESVFEYLESLHLEIETNRFPVALMKNYAKEQIRLEKTLKIHRTDHQQWNVALVGNITSSNGAVSLGGLSLNRIARAIRPGSFIGEIVTLINPIKLEEKLLGDEALDLIVNSEIIAQVKQKISQGYKLSEIARLDLRERPLLCIYALDPNSQGKTEHGSKSTLPLAKHLMPSINEANWPQAFIGVSIFFPRDSEQKNSVTYLVGNAGRRNYE